MKCKHCGTVILVTPQTKIIKELGIEFTVKQQQNNIKFNDIEIPKGFRLIKATEIMKFWDNKTFRETLLKENDNNLWFFVENLDCYKKDYVARFDAFSGRAGLYCDWYPGSSDSRLGVIFVRGDE